MLNQNNVDYLLCLWPPGINVARYYWVMEPAFSGNTNFIARCKMPLLMMMSRLFDVMFPVQHSDLTIITGSVIRLHFCTLSLNALKKYVSMVFNKCVSRVNYLIDFIMRIICWKRS